MNIHRDPIMVQVRRLRRLLATNANLDRDLIGRWALPSGAAITVKRVDPDSRLADVRCNARLWRVPAYRLHHLRVRGALRYLGRTK